MKAHKKVKQSLFVNDSQAQSKPNTPRTVVGSHNTQHRKLLQYKDYLLSLRKMDLATLIQQNKSRKTSSTQAKATQLIKQPKQPFINKDQQSLKTSHKQTQQQLSKKNQQLSKPPKVKQISLKIDKPLSIIKKQQHLKEQQPIHQLNKPKRNSFKLVLKADMQQDDLYCDQDMQEIMKAPQISTPRLIHINNFCNIQTHRDYSTHRSSKHRDLSMPSIEERNLSQESEESLDKNGNFTARSISEGINHRKQNSGSFSTPLNAEKQTGKKQNSKQIAESVKISLVPKAEAKEEMNKTFDNSYLFSTNDFSAKSKAENDLETNKNNRFDLKITPFDYQPEFSHIKHKPHLSNHPSNDPQTFSRSQPKQPHKLSLNVSEIVRRINNRESKSSMSDRSYRKQHQNKNVNNIIHTSRESHEKMYSDMMKQKFSEFLSNQSTLPLKQIHLIEQVSKKKSFKTQVKEFREKHFLMMRLA